MALNRFPAGTIAVLVDERSVVQMVGEIYGYGEDLHKNEPNYNEAYWKDVIQFSEHLGHGLPNQQVYKLDAIPEEIVEPYSKWCYTEAEGFTINPNYVEPPEPSPYDGVSPEMVDRIQTDTIEAVIDEVSEVTE